MANYTVWIKKLCLFVGPCEVSFMESTSNLPYSVHDCVYYASLCVVEGGVQIWNWCKLANVTTFLYTGILHCKVSIPSHNGQLHTGK